MLSDISLERQSEGLLVVRHRCPRCRHLVGATLRDVPQRAFRAGLTCNCTEKHPGQREEQGCGAFWQLEIVGTDGTRDRAGENEPRTVSYEVDGRPALRFEFPEGGIFQAELFDGYYALAWSTPLTFAEVIERVGASLPAAAAVAVVYDEQTGQHRRLSAEAVLAELRQQPKMAHGPRNVTTRERIRRSIGEIIPLEPWLTAHLDPGALGAPPWYRRLRRIWLRLLRFRVSATLRASPFIRVELEHLTLTWTTARSSADATPTGWPALGVISDVLDPPYLAELLRLTGTAPVAEQGDSLMASSQFLHGSVERGRLAATEETLT